MKYSKIIYALLVIVLTSTTTLSANADDNDELHRFAVANMMAKNTLFTRLQTTVAYGCAEKKLDDLCKIDLSKNAETISGYLTYKMVRTYQNVDDIVKLGKCNHDAKMSDDCKPYLTNLGLWMKEAVIAIKLEEKIATQIDEDATNHKLMNYFNQ